MRLVLLFLPALAWSATTLIGPEVGPFNRLVWSDDFDILDFQKWRHEITAGGGGNWEFQIYSNNRSNSFVRDGKLFIKPTLTADRIGEGPMRNGYHLSLWGGAPANLCTSNAFYGCERIAGAGGNYLNPIQSARIRTVDTFNFKYGRLEVRAKLPKGDWLWPAIWLMPTFETYGMWPASGEIDLMESKGNAFRGGVDTFGSTLHWGPFWPENGWLQTHAEVTLNSGDFASDFHVFGLYWDRTTMYTYLDTPSNVVLHVNISNSFWEKGGWNNRGLDNPWEGRGKNAPFDQPYYLILNVAVGGTCGYFEDGVGAKPWSNRETHAANSFWNAKNRWYPTWQNDQVAMQVDWVRVYQ